MLLEEHARWPKPARLERLEARDNAEDEAAQLSAMLRTVAALRAIPVVVWVGHEPSLSRFASLLLAGSADAIAIDFRKGAALSLEVQTSRERDDLPRARFRWMLTPNVVRRLTKR
jgi:phosphohistidine phosphatase SixA